MNVIFSEDNFRMCSFSQSRDPPQKFFKKKRAPPPPKLLKLATGLGIYMSYFCCYHPHNIII